ncbi:MAG: hypothetical protein JST16_14905 [Bdellovibrionales bacterium]|nr:hypothetical protein [Bdellovibrionales bacterium]
MVPNAEQAVGQLLHVRIPTPVFAQASAKSKVLADVDEGTTLLLRAFSPQKTWLLVEDEDRNRGWVPRDRTDYTLSAIAPPEETKGTDAAAAKLQGATAFDTQRDQLDAQPPLPPVRSVHELAAWTRSTFRSPSFDPNGNFGYGVLYSFMLPSPGLSATRQRLAMAGLQTGYARAHASGVDNGFTIPLRYRLLSRDFESSFTLGPDLGLLMFRRQGSDETFWSFAFGYSVGFTPVTSGFSFLGRLGLDFVNSTRLSVEFALGWRL